MELKHGYKQTEVGVIPEDWDVKTLSELGKLKNGINKGKDDFGHGFPFINLLDVFGVSRISRSNEEFGLVNSTMDERKLYELKGGDVLFVRSSVKPEGVGLTTLIPEDLPDTVFSGFLIRFRDCGLLDIGFKEYCFGDEHFRARLVSNSTVSANTNINQEALKRLKIGFPPNPKEQCAIGAALSDVDALLEGLDRLIAKKRDLKQAAMQQLLTGKTRLPGFKGEWIERKLVEVADFYDNLRIPVTESKREIGITPYYGANGIQGHINGHTHDGEFVLIAEDGANDLNNYPVFYVNGKVWVNNHAHVIQGRPDRATTKYLSYALKHVDFVQVLVGGTRAKLNGSEAKAIETIMPSDIEEQAAIAAVLSDMDAEIAELEQRRTKTADLKQAMMQELLTGRTRLV